MADAHIMSFVTGEGGSMASGLPPASAEHMTMGDPSTPTWHAFVEAVRTHVETRLRWWLDARVREASVHGSDAAIVADAMRALVLRGGKRMRAVLLAAAYVACDRAGAGRNGPSAPLLLAPAGAALELLHAYLLTHDDWMDGDAVRRGGPSVPAMMRERFAGDDADAASILADD